VSFNEDNEITSWVLVVPLLKKGSCEKIYEVLANSENPPDPSLRPSSGHAFPKRGIRKSRERIPNT
jgi:hypothetical protein